MKRDATQTLFSCQFSIGLSHNTMLLLCYNDNRAASPWRYSLILMCVMLADANIVGVVLRCSVWLWVYCFVVTRAFGMVARLLIDASTDWSISCLWIMRTFLILRLWDFEKSLTLCTAWLYHRNHHWYYAPFQHLQVVCRHNASSHKHPRVDENLSVGIG